MQSQQTYVVFTACDVHAIVHVVLRARIQEPLKWTLLFKGIGAYPQLFEALNSMLTRNTLNPADMATVSLSGNSTGVPLNYSDRSYTHVYICIHAYIHNMHMSGLVCSSDTSYLLVC